MSALASVGAVLGITGWLSRSPSSAPHPEAATRGAAAHPRVASGPRVDAPDPRERAAPSPPSSSSQATPEEPLDRLERVRRAARDPSGPATALLLDALDSEDDVARLEALDALVERKHAPALARILTMDPVADAYLGPTILGALGELGAAADARDRDAALERLVQLLAGEKERGGTDSAGYVVSIIEALGALGHPKGASVLERELFDPFYDVAARTTIVFALGRIGQPSSLEPLARLRALLQEEPRPEEDFARALDGELRAAIDDVTRALRAR